MSVTQLTLAHSGSGLQNAFGSCRSGIGRDNALCRCERRQCQNRKLRRNYSIISSARASRRQRWKRQGSFGLGRSAQKNTPPRGMVSAPSCGLKTCNAAHAIGLGFGWKIHPLMPPNCRRVANLARVTTHQVTGRQQATTSPKTPAATSQPSDGQWDCNFISGCRSVLGDAGI